MANDIFFCDRCGKAYFVADGPCSCRAPTTAVIPNDSYRLSDAVDALAKKATPLFHGALSVLSVFLLSIGGWFALLTILSTVGYLTGNIRLICIAGFLWVATALLTTAVISFAHSTIRTASAFIDGAVDLFPESSVLPLKLIALVLDALRTIAHGTERFFYSRLLAAAWFIEFATATHLYLARHSQLDSRPLANWTVVGSITALYAVVGYLADRAAPEVTRHQNDAMRAAPQKQRLSVGISYFTSSFEFVRCSLLMGCGIWGTTAFNAADSILTFPTVQQMTSGAFFKTKFTDAYTLFLSLTPSVFWTFFLVLPAIWVLGFALDRTVGLVRRLFRGATTVHVSSAALILGGWLLLLSWSVAKRSGMDLIAQFIALSYIRTEALDQEIGTCAKNSADIIAFTPCIDRWRQAWDAEGVAQTEAFAAALSKKERAVFQKRRAGWRAYISGLLDQAAATTDPSRRATILAMTGEEARIVSVGFRNAKRPTTPAKP